MRISYILPVYNTGNKILNNIESIIAQEYEDIEIIYVDDNSTDEVTVDIIKACMKRDSRIQLIELNENVGAGQARKIGFEASTGEIVSFLDPDDQLTTKISEKVISLLDKEWDIVQVSVDVINQSDGKYKPKLGNFKLDRLNLPKTFIERRVATKKMPNALWAYYFKRELLLGIEFPGHSPSSDAPISIPALAKSEWIRTTDLVGYQYIIHDSSVSVKKVTPQKMENLINNHHILMENLADISDDNLIKRYAFIMSLQVMIYDYFYMERNQRSIYRKEIHKFNQKYKHLKIPVLYPSYFVTKLLIKFF